MKAAIYTRVSSEEQVDNYSLSAQLNELNSYCEKNNITVHQVYTDEGVSGTKEDRPAFQKMIRDAEHGLFQIILVHKFDRFARKVEISQKVKNRLKKSSVNVISITEPIENSPIGFFQEGLLELLSEYYVRNLATEVKKGLKERVLEGMPPGSIPYGYKSDNGKIVIDEEKAKVVLCIFEKYLQGDGYGKIANHLNENRIPKLRGGAWRHDDISRMLYTTLYYGKITYNGNLYESKVEPIISEEMFWEVQNSRSSKKRNVYITDNKKKYLLAGIARCGICKRNLKLWYQTYKDKRYYSYMCGMASKYKKVFCTNTRITRTNKIDAELILALKDAAEKNIVIKIPQNAQIEFAYEDRKKKITSELERLKAAYLRGLFEIDEFEETKKRLIEELKTCEKTRIVNKIEVKEVYRKFSELEDPFKQKQLLEKYITAIELYPDRLEIEWKNSL